MPHVPRLSATQGSIKVSKTPGVATTRCACRSRNGHKGGRLSPKCKSFSLGDILQLILSYNVLLGALLRLSLYQLSNFLKTWYMLLQIPEQ